jgi:iron complex outermembrane receptor protein
MGPGRIACVVVRLSRRQPLGCVWLAICASASGTAHADENAQPPREGDIVVTARLREERLDNTPLAISARSGAALDRQQIFTLNALAGSLPGLSLRSAASNKDWTLFIRGVGTATTSSGAEPSVAVVLDGVSLMRPGAQMLEVSDIARIEVLKGPQGTLFGRNASAGVINIVTTAPTPYWSANAFAEATSDSEQRIKATISGPLMDGLSFQVTSLGARFNGNVRELDTDKMVNGFRRAGIRGKLQYEPSAALKIVAISDLVRNHADTPYAVYSSQQRIAFGSNIVTSSPALDAALAAEGLVPSPGNDVSSGRPSRIDDTNGGVSLQADVSLPFGVLTSISAMRWWHNHQAFDLTGFNAPQPGVPLLDDDGQLRFHQVSEELRLASRSTGALSYVAGFLFLRGQSNETYLRTVTTIDASGVTRVGSGDADWAITSTHYSVFGEATWKVLPRLALLLGGRLIRDDLDYRHERVLAGTQPVSGVFPAHQSNGGTAGDGYALHTGLQFTPSPEAMAYASFTRGYKGPAINVFFNMRNIDEQPLAPETSQGYEIGFKGKAFDRRLDISVDAFLTRYFGFQASYADVFLGAPITRLINAGRVSTRGVEAQLSFKASSALTLAVDAARIDAHIDHFNCPPISASCQTYSIDGRPLAFAPKWQAFASADYRQPLSSTIDGLASLSYSYVSSMMYLLDQSPDALQPAHGRIDASIGASFGDGRYELRLFARNLAGDRYSSTVLTSSSGGGLIRLVPRDERRYFGLTLLARR